MTTAYSVSNAVPLSTLPTTNGVQQQFFAPNTNDGPATFSPDGLSAAPIVGLAGHALQGNEIPAGALVSLSSYIGPLLNSGALCWLLIDCAGGAQQITPASRGEQAVTLDQLNKTGRSGIRGLVGKANATSPATKFDFSTASRTFRDPNTRIVQTSYNTSVITVDANLAGPVLNGRDQAGAFTAGSWIYLYALSDGKGSEGAVFSANPPSVGPNNVPGYPYVVLITALYWTSQSVIRRVVASGNTVYEAAQISIAASGNTAGSEIAFSTALACPPIALRWKARINSYISTNSGGGGTARRAIASFLDLKRKKSRWGSQWRMRQHMTTRKLNSPMSPNSSSWCSLLRRARETLRRSSPTSSLSATLFPMEITESDKHRARKIASSDG